MSPTKRYKPGDQVRHRNTKRTAIVKDVRPMRDDYDELYVQPLVPLGGSDLSPTWWSAMFVEAVDA